MNNILYSFSWNYFHDIVEIRNDAGLMCQKIERESAWPFSANYFFKSRISIFKVVKKNV